LWTRRFFERLEIAELDRLRLSIFGNDEVFGREARDGIATLVLENDIFDHHGKGGGEGRDTFSGGEDLRLFVRWRLGRPPGPLGRLLRYANQNPNEKCRGEGSHVRT